MRAFEELCLGFVVVCCICRILKFRRVKVFGGKVFG